MSYVSQLKSLSGIFSGCGPPPSPILLGTGPLHCFCAQNRLFALTPSLTFCICLFSTRSEPTYNPKNPLSWVSFDSCSQKPSMAPNSLLNQMKSPILMIIFTPKCLHLHSIRLLGKELLSNHLVPSCILGPVGNYKLHHIIPALMSFQSMRTKHTHIRHS